MMRTIAVCCVLCISHGAICRAADPPAPRIHTIREETITAQLKSIELGRLLLDVQPWRELPLDEIARIEWNRAAALAAVWIGQDNRNETAAKEQVQRYVGGQAAVATAERANDLQDIHLTLTGLPAGRTIQQVAVNGRGVVWKLDQEKEAGAGEPTNPNQAGGLGRLLAGLLNSAGKKSGSESSQARLVIQRNEIGDTAELFLEPKVNDLFGQTLTLAVTFDDDSVATAAVKAGTHTQRDLKVGTASPVQDVAAPQSGARATVYLDLGDRLTGQLLALDKDSLRIKTAWSEDLRIPLIAVRGVGFSARAGTEGGDLFYKHLAAPADVDVAVALNKEQAASIVMGQAEGFAEGKLQFAFEGQSRSISQARLIGLVLAARPAPMRERGLYQTVQLLSGDTLSGQWTAVAADTIEVRPFWGGQVMLPASGLSGIAFRNGKLVYLSDLEPLRVEEAPYFTRTWPYRRDVSLTGDPLRMKGRAYAKGLAVHSRSVLTYDLGAQYGQFKAAVGFDDAVAGRGSVACRVLADGKVLFEQSELRGDRDPVPIDLPIAGVKELTLEVDFGAQEDNGDRVIWGAARVLR